MKSNQQFSDLLSQIPAFSSLDTSEIEALSNAAVCKTTPRYNFVYMQDEVASDICFLMGGSLKMGVFSADGREVVKEVLHPGAMFGDLCLVGETRRSEFALALYDEVKVFYLPVDAVKCMMAQNQQLMFSIMSHLSQRLNKVEERLTKLIVQDARERIIEFLVDTAAKEGRRVGLETLVRHRLTQQDIASLTGTSRQTVTSVLNDLKKSNLIYFNRNSILIRDVQKLA